MKKIWFLKIAVFASIVFLVSCFGPSTPQEVTQKFWQSVISGDVGDVVNYSTLTDTTQYDGFSENWTGYKPSVGKIIIDSNHASIETRLISTDKSNEDARVFTTLLVLRDKRWLVDYEETRNDIQGGPLGGLIGKIERAGKTLSRQLGEAAHDLDSELKGLGEKIEQRAHTIDTETREKINDISDKIRQHIDELQRSIERAIEKENWSDHDRQVLHEISEDLSDEQKRLSDQDLEAIAVSSKNIGKSQQRLNDIDSNKANSYKKDWNSMIKNIKKNISDLADDL